MVLPTSGFMIHVAAGHIRHMHLSNMNYICSVLVSYSSMWILFIIDAFLEVTPCIYNFIHVSLMYKDYLPLQLNILKIASPKEY